MWYYLRWGPYENLTVYISTFEGQGKCPCWWCHQISSNIPITSPMGLFYGGKESRFNFSLTENMKFIQCRPTNPDKLTIDCRFHDLPQCCKDPLEYLIFITTQKTKLQGHLDSYVDTLQKLKYLLSYDHICRRLDLQYRHGTHNMSIKALFTFERESCIHIVYISPIKYNSDITHVFTSSDRLDTTARPQKKMMDNIF